MADASSSSETLYAAPATERPTIEQLCSVAEALHLHISADELEEYKCTYHLHVRQLRLVYRMSVA